MCKHKSITKCRHHDNYSLYNLKTVRASFITIKHIEELFRRSKTDSFLIYVSIHLGYLYTKSSITMIRLWEKDGP